jgi:hypothetical protein
MAFGAQMQLLHAHFALAFHRPAVTLWPTSHKARELRPKGCAAREI